MKSFSVSLCLRGDPVVLTARSHNRQLVAACDGAARRRGVAAGMTVAHAQALLSGSRSIIQPLEPAADRQRLDALAQWAARRFSPLAQVDPFCQPGAEGSQGSQGSQGSLLLDITGCQRLFGGEDRLLGRLVAGVARLGFDARAASADTIGCAWGVARYSGRRICAVEPGRQREALADLPAAALRLDDGTIAGLSEVGLRTVGQLLAVPADLLRERFGPELVKRIDQALGRAWESVQPVEQETIPRVELLFGGPVRNLETIMLGARNLLGQLLEKLQASNRGVRRLELVLDRSDAGPLTLSIPLAAASHNEKHLWALLRPAVEAANMGFGVEGLRMTARETAELEYSQAPLLPQALPAGQRSGGRMNRQLGELVDVLASRLGDEAITAVEPVESHVPESAFVRRPAKEGTTLRSRRARLAASVSERVAERAPEFHIGDRPSVLLDNPEPIEVTALSPDGPVVGFSRKGQYCRVVTCIGPERISPQWWGNREGRGSKVEAGAESARPSSFVPRPSCRGESSPADRPSSRDYFKIQDDAGRWMWLCRRRRDNAWFVQGLWL